MSQLFQEMLYDHYRKIGGIFNGRKTDFWDSKNKSKYSNQYSLLSKTDPTALFSESKREQMTCLNSLIASKYTSQFKNAQTFIENIYRPLSIMENGREKFLSGNDILKKVNEFFNMPLKSGGGQGYSGITNAEKMAAKEIENIFASMGVEMGAKGSIQQNLLTRLNSLLVQVQNFENQAAEYGSIKGQEVEKMISDFLNTQSWAKNIQTGNIFRNGAQLGEDIMIINDLDKIANEIQNSQVTLSIDDSEYLALKAAERFSIQVKSGVHQSIFNKDNSLYKVSLQELTQTKQLQMLHQLKEWDSTQSKFENNGAVEGSRLKNLNKSHTQQSGYFTLWPKSESLRAIATYALSKSSGVLQSLYRISEYQVYWVMPYGFITLPEYLQRTGYFWQFANTKQGFDFTPNFMLSKRQITLSKSM